MNMEIGEQPDTLHVKTKSRLPLIAIFAIVGLVAAVIVAGGTWYTLSLRPVSSLKRATVYTLESGSTVRQVGSDLAGDHLIRSELAFRLYMRLHGGDLKAGTYHLNQNMSVAAIANVLISGKQSNYTITFYPGATLEPVTSTAKSKRMDARSILERAGFSDQEITRALQAEYDSPLFASKPKGTSLEGYVYGETYQVDSSSSPETILKTTFDTFWQKITEKDLVNRLKKRGFNLYQGITLASMIQAEASSLEDQRQIAQVFELRLKENMPLGSDVTFIYAANKLGVAATPDLKSPYNTRIHTGLPPGPIGSPSIEALDAVASPAKGDYLYFVAGDDGTVHYAKTIEQHEENTKKYCTKLCS